MKFNIDRKLDEELYGKLNEKLGEIYPTLCEPFLNVTSYLFPALGFPLSAIRWLDLRFCCALGSTSSAFNNDGQIVVPDFIARNDTLLDSITLISNPLAYKQIHA